MPHKLFANGILVENNPLRHIPYIVKHNLFQNMRRYIVRETIRFPIPFEPAAVEIIFVIVFLFIPDIAHFQFSAAIGAVQKSGKRMRNARMRLSAVWLRFHALLYSVPKLLRNDGRMRIINDHPVARVFLYCLMVLIRNGGKFLLRQMPEVGYIFQYRSDRCLLPVRVFVVVIFSAAP